MPSSEFQRICRDMALLSESIKIQVVKDTVNFTSSGDSGNGSITLHSGRGGVDNETEGIHIDLEQPVSLSFPLKYLNHFAKASSLSPTVTMSLAERTPLLVEFRMEEDLGYIRYPHQ
ncbi:proliferating cell nuclear antigen [Coelomomyces lativittatus]|nr:proliferating cell nuclear antigen [Coelomomyces lativittatus]